MELSGRKEIFQVNLKYLIVADDFTGSNDTGVQMTKRGIETEVILSPKEEKNDLSLVIDTESRHLSQNDAYTRVASTFEKLIKNNKFNLVYKKIDSTLRGNVADEVLALVDSYKPEKVIFAPGYPGIGRFVKDQIHYVNNKRLLETEFSKDPLSPITTDNIEQLLSKRIGNNVTHHNVENIREKKISLKPSMYHTFDSVTDQDLIAIVEQVLKYDSKILWVGSAGLANALFSVLNPINPSLAVVGSISQISLDQIDYAEKKGKEVLYISSKDIFDKVDINKYVNKAMSLLDLNKDVIITAARTKDDYQYTLKLGRENSLTKEDSSWYVKDYLSKVVQKIIKLKKISGVYLTGGDTAISIIDKLNGKGCIIESEVLTGIVHSKLTGGKLAGLNLITKAGAFGNKESLFKSLEILKEL